MIRLIMNKDWGNFNSLLTVLAVLYTCVFLSVLIGPVLWGKACKTPENSPYQFRLPPHHYQTDQLFWFNDYAFHCRYCGECGF